MTVGTIKWGSGPGGIALNEADVLAETPAAGDLTPVFDVSAGEGKSIARSWSDRKREVVAPITANLSVADMADTVISNYGMTDADAALTLPTCGPGMRARFVVFTARAKKWGVRAGAADNITIIAVDGTVATGADNGYARFTNAVLGQCMDVWSYKSGASTWDWMAQTIAIASSTLAAN